MFGRKRSGATGLTIVSAMLWYLTLGGMHIEAAEPSLDLTSRILRTSFVAPKWFKLQTQDWPTVFDPPAGVEQDLCHGEGSFANRTCESRADKTQRWFESPQYESADIFRAQSPDGCGSVAQGYSFEETHTPSFRLTEFNVYPTFSYLDDDSATYNEFEFASQTDFGFVEMENRTVLNVADLPSTISLGPTNPGEPSKTRVRANGFGDILSGFFFSPKGSHDSNVHIGVGPVITFPTASNQILGSNQYTAGPGIHASAEIGKLTTGFFLWQSWGFGENAGEKKVNQLFGKPFVLYELSEEWNLVYIPLGLSHSFDAKSGDDWTVPVGGGIRRLCTIRGQKMGLQMQAFDYVARKAKDPEWELRFTIEFLLDE